MNNASETSSRIKPVPAAIALLLMIAAVVAVRAGGRPELVEVRTMEIADIDLSSVPDGVWEGEFTYGSSVQRVAVHVQAGVIAEIEVLEGSETDHGLQGRGVLDRVVDEQRTNVDAVTGATTTSKAYLKAVERALLFAIASDHPPNASE